MIVDHRGNHTTINAVSMACDTVLKSLYGHAHILNGAFRAGNEIYNIPSLTGLANNTRRVKKKFLISYGTSKCSARIEHVSTENAILHTPREIGSPGIGVWARGTPRIVKYFCIQFAGKCKDKKKMTQY